MDRRAFVATAGGTLATLAGCVGSRPPTGDSVTPSPPSARSPDDTPTATAAPTPTADVTVESLELQYGVVTPNSPDSIGISHPETPYLVSSVRVEGALPWEAFGLVAGDVRYSPTRLDRLYRTTWGDDHWYERGRSDGLVLFEAPTPSESLRLSWPGGEHPVDDSLLARLRAPPPQLSATLDVPDRHTGVEAPPVDVTVTNDGAVDGRFLGALNRVGPLVAYTPVARLSRLVPAGERVTVSVADSWGGRPGDERLGDDEPDVTYLLNYAGGEDSAGIRLAEADAGSG